MIRTCLALTLMVPIGPCQHAKVRPEANDRLVCVRKPWLVPPPHQRVPK